MNSKKKTIHDKKSPSQGFTLIEVLIALAILSIGLLGAASMQYSSAKSNRISREATLGNTAASDCAEDLMNTSYADLVDGEKDQGGFHIEWTVTEFDVDDPPDMENEAKRVDITVTSSNTGAKKSTFSLISTKTKFVR